MNHAVTRAGPGGGVGVQRYVAYVSHMSTDVQHVL